MRNKKLLILFFLVLPVFILAGCTNRSGQPENMDELSDNNEYHYRNEMLGFSLILPSTFEYYQTQRTDEDNYTELEIFVPTNDTTLPTEVPSYANPITVRVYGEAVWENVSRAEISRGFQEAARQDGEVFVLRFWPEVPSDWEDRWSEEVESKMKEGLEIL
jgi:hypothetical protein